MGIVKIYSYSSELLTFVEEKWIRPKLAVVCALIGISLFFGMIRLNRSTGITSGARAAKMLVVENSVLRQELIAIHPRLNKLGVQTRSLGTQDNDLHAFLAHQEIVGDSVTGFTDSAKWVILQYLNPPATNFRP